MATGHVLPGYGDPISKMRRVQSAGYPLDRKTLLQIAQDTRLKQEEVDCIRNNARRLWSYPQKEETSYDNHYKERLADELMTLRPTSPTRRNKPHPIPTFLTNRLHYIPGYHNADTALGKETYRVDASVPAEQRDQRVSARRKYLGRTDSAMASPYRDAFGLKEQLDGRSAQAAEAWLKIADDKDRHNVLNVIEKERARDQAHDQHGGVSPRPVSAYPSMHRWMRYAGSKESDAVGRIVQTLESDPDKICVGVNPYHTKPPPSVLSVRRRDLVKMANVNFRPPKPSRGDFLMHPDWPPSIPHHRIP